MKSKWSIFLSAGFSAAALAMSIQGCSPDPTGSSKSAVENDSDACTQSSDCDSDEVCRDGLCKDAIPCKSNTDCDSGEVCNSGECE